MRTLLDTFIAILQNKDKSPGVRLFAPLQIMLKRHSFTALTGALLARPPVVERCQQRQCAGLVLGLAVRVAGWRAVMATCACHYPMICR